MENIDINDFEFLRDIPSELNESKQKLEQQCKANSIMRTAMWIAIGISIAITIAFLIIYDTSNQLKNKEEK